MSVLQAIVLGAVQGLTEFVPISSSGHLVLVPEALGWEHPGLAFDVLLHAASLLALLWYFRRDMVQMARGIRGGDRRQRALGLLLLIGTVPAAVAGLVLGDYFERSFEDAKSAAVQLVVTALILVVAEVVASRHRTRATELRSMDRLNAADATIIGTAQAVSILPGISRSGATIGAGLALRLEREEAARFAFLLAIPALAGAAVVEIPDLAASEVAAGPAAAGFAASLASSYLAIAGLLRYLRTNTLYPFAVYCVIAGAIFYVLV